MLYVPRGRLNKECLGCGVATTSLAPPPRTAAHHLKTAVEEDRSTTLTTRKRAGFPKKGRNGSVLIPLA